MVTKVRRVIYTSKVANLRRFSNLCTSTSVCVCVCVCMYPVNAYVYDNLHILNTSIYGSVYGCTYVYLIFAFCKYRNLLYQNLVRVKCRKHTYKLICVYVCMHVCICMYVCMYVRTYVCVCVCMYICMYVCIRDGRY